MKYFINIGKQRHLKNMKDKFNINLFSRICIATAYIAGIIFCYSIPRAVIFLILFELRHT